MRVLGLDIGITSIGWAIVEFDKDAKNEIDKEDKNKIINLGVRLFDGVAEDRSGNLLTKDWRNSKSSRHRYKRKKERLKIIEKEFRSIGFLDNNYAIILINTLIKSGAKFDQINIELARDLPLTTKEKKRYSESQRRNEENKKSAKAIVGQNAKNKDILKARLLIEQDYQCPYCNIKLNSSDIADNKVEVDHILPLSLSFDDSYTNKVLAHKECNQLKGQRIPRSGFLDDEWFVRHINSMAYR